MNHSDNTYFITYKHVIYFDKNVDWLGDFRNPSLAQSPY